jgi:hypothetical protein
MLVGIDPGKATGIAVWRDGALDLGLTGEYTLEQAFSFLDRFCGDVEHQQVEWFTISERTIKTDIDYTAIHLIGAIQYAAWRCGNTLSYSSPAEVKRQFPDAALRKAGMWHRSDHARDAIRHLCRHLVGAGILDARRFLLDDDED